MRRLKRKSPLRWIHRLLLIGAGLAALLLAVLWITMPDIAWLKTNNPHETALMAFRRVEAQLQNRRPHRYWRRVPLGRISPYLIQAVLIAEDDKFFEHEGFDWASMRKALEANIKKKKVLRGGSTITQQLAKNLYLSPSQSVIRKVREAAIAFMLEHTLSKKRILELYLNIIEWGDGIFGAEAAARMYFGKPAMALSLAEAIRLASVLPNPHRFSPTRSNSRRMNRKRRIIAERMRQRGLISAAQYPFVLSELNSD